MEFLQPIDSLEGFSPVVREKSLARQARINEAARLWVDVLDGRQDPYFLRQAMMPSSEHGFRVLTESYPRLFQEAMSTSDFLALTADVLDRALLGYYSGVPIPNLGLAKKATLRDFRNRKLFFEDGMVTPFEKLGEFEVAKQRALTDNTPILYSPDVYAGAAKLSWRALMNDDLGIFQDIPKRLALAAQRTLHKFITTLYMDVNGPHAGLFKTAFANQIITANGAQSNNPALSAGGLSDAFTVMMKQVDSGGDPIMIPGKLFLVVGPALFTTAKNLMNTLTQDVSVEGGTQNAQGFPTRRIRVNNWMVGNLELVLDPYMPIVCTAAGIRNTSWMLIADPATQERPALELGYLRGFDQPQLFQKLPNTQRIGGGVDPTMGDYHTMNTEMKAVMAFGGVQIDGRSAVASTGAGV